MKGLVLFYLMLIAFTFPAFATAGSCAGDLATGGVPLFRDYRKFSSSVLARYKSVRQNNLPPNHHWTLSHGDEPAARVIRDLIQRLAEASGLGECLTQPEPIYVVIQKNGPDRMPFAEMKSGIFTINRAMLDLAETDDELAEIVGHEMLHHTLGHTLKLIQLQQSYWFRAMGLGSSSGGFSGTDTTAPWDYRRETLKKHYDAYETEARRATIPLLKNAGFDPWSLVTVWEKQLIYSEKTEGPRYDGRELRAITEEARGWLTSMGLQPKNEKKSDWVTALKSALNAN